MTVFNRCEAHRIGSGFHPDPSVCVTPEGRYLLVNSSFEFFPGLPMFDSPDGYHWSRIPDAVSRPGQFVYDRMGNSQGMYAPTIRYGDGRYYLIVTNVNKGTMMMTSDDPVRGWSDPLWIDGWPGIDPSLFFDDDGSVYICGNESASPDPGQPAEPAGIYMARIDVGTGRITSPRRRICAGVTGANPEGPHMYKRRGVYYLMWAEGGTESGHMENIARASDPYGPYDMYPGNPLITNRSTHLTLQGIGHCDMAGCEADRTLMVFHGFRCNDEYPAQAWIGRESYSTWFRWRDGWPDLSDQSFDCPLKGDGESGEREVHWMTPGIDRLHLHEVLEAPDGTSIRVKAVEQDFGIEETVPFIGTRQTGFFCRFGVRCPRVADLRRGEAGIVVYANQRHYVTFAFHRSPQRATRLLCHAYNEGLVSRVASVSLDDALPLRLMVRADSRGYSFAFGQGSGALVDIGRVPGKLLGFSSAGGFTGTMLGVYAHGAGEVVFRDVDYSCAG
ncbi:MAG: glycoside hydrolase family 43 protein [Bifidobacterium sp.]|jgi:xylan 1,4-beta-xylosidase|nr:glycoside hydrolase family 43 protein [Bifidobacterium sp.]MCI1865069.1 glycoside hydrolase family 43 protein [Bifidobacterium sp.]